MVAFNSLLVFLWQMQIFQQLANWRLDWPSLVVGVLLGAGLVWLFFRFRPRLDAVRDQSVERVQQTQAWVRAGTEKRLQAETSAYVARYHLGRKWATLAEIFVPPLLLDEPPIFEPDGDEAPEVESGLRARLDTGYLIYLWPELAAGIGLPPPPARSLHELLRNGRRVIIASPAGWGKTTLLAYAAHLCATATGDGPDSFLLPVLPVFVHLAELNLGGEDDPVSPLAAAIQRRSSALTAPGIDKLLRQKLSRGQALLLLDGWDELAPGQDEEPATWLQQLLAEHPDIRVIVATATAGYGRLAALGFVTSGIVPWRGRQALALGSQWASVAERSEPPQLGWFWQPGDSALAATLCLWQNLWRSRSRRTAPASKLLERSLPLLLPEEVEAAGLGEVAQELWQRLAFALLAASRLALPAHSVQEAIEATIAAHGVEVKASLLWQAIRENPLFRQWPDRSISIVSPLWRDYLAAGYLANTSQLEMVAEKLDDGHWQETISFFVTRAGEHNLAANPLESRSTDLWREELFQIAAWLPDAPQGREWLRQTLIQLGRLIVAPDAPLPLRQRAIAAIAHSGDPGAFHLLRQLLQRSDTGLRLVAAAALGRLDPDHTVPVLEQLCADGEAPVREAAVHSLGWQNSQRGEKALLSALVGADEVMARAAAEALAHNGGEGWEILEEAAGDEMTLVRRAAARGLGAVREPWAISWLEKLERDSEWIVRSAATQELEQIAVRGEERLWQPLEAGELLWLIAWAAQRKRAVPAGAAAIPVLCEVLISGHHPDDRTAAATSLVRVALPDSSQGEVESALREAVQNDENERVRAAAFAALTLLQRKMAA